MWLRWKTGSTKNHVLICRLRFVRVDEKRTGYCFRVRKHNGSEANGNTRQLTSLGPPSTNSVPALHANARQIPLTVACGGLERSGRHGLKPMLRPPSASSVTMASRRLPGSYQSTEWMGDGQTSVASWLCVGNRLLGRNARTTVVREQRQRNTDSCLRLGRSRALPGRLCEN